MSDLPPDEGAMFARLLAKKEATKNAKPSAVAAREATIAEKKKIAEDARLSAHFEEIGLGDVPEDHRQDMEYFLKHLENMSQVFEDARASENTKWFKDKTTTKLLSAMEEHFYGLSSSAIQIIARSNLGDFKPAAKSKATKIQEASRKRQRAQEEKDEPRLGCTCGCKSAGRHGKCVSARCPCRQAGKPCSDHCRCTVDNCQNPSGLPPARDSARGRGRPSNPATLERTLELPPRTSTARLYEDSDSDSCSDGGSPGQRYQYRTKQTARPPIRRLARRGGVKRIPGPIYEETRCILRVCALVCLLHLNSLCLGSRGARPRYPYTL